VARIVDPPDFRIVEVAQDLDVPIRSANALLKVERGATVSEGDPLAVRPGLNRRVCRSPITGRVVGVGRGRLLLEATPRVRRVPALVPGYVIDARPSAGVIIELVGGLIQAIWGNGKEAYGVLRLLVREPRHAIRPAQINASAQGSILIGGAVLDEESIDQADELQVRGMVVGSVPASLVPRLQRARFPVVATEGVGTVPMSQVIFDLLSSMDGREAAVCGDIGDRWRTERPFVAVPMPTQAAQAIDPDAPVQAGDRIRVLNGEYRGRSGRVTRVLEGLVQLETGARLPGAEIMLENEAVVRLPYLNMERLL
jgi:hypothetical protein